MQHFDSDTGWHQPYSFDWYAFTPEMNRDEFISSALTGFPDLHLEPGRGRLGFSSSDLLCDPSGSPVFAVLHSGGSECHVQLTGSAANRCALWVRKSIPHLLSRCDIALDYMDADFDHMTNLFLAASITEKVKSRYIGPHPDSGDALSGRTVYLGSRSSAGMFRVYEKGKQMRDPDRLQWVRVEYEFKPQNSDARSYYSTCPIIELVSSTKISRAVFGMLAVQIDQAPVPAGSLPADPEFDRTLRHLKKQYSRTLQRLLHDLDFDSVAFVDFLLSE